VGAHGAEQPQTAHTNPESLARFSGVNCFNVVFSPRAVDRRLTGVLANRDRASLVRRNILKDSKVQIGLDPIATLQYSSTTLYQVSDHIRKLFFLK
jgi:hypothetical protein